MPEISFIVSDHSFLLSEALKAAHLHI